MNPIFQMIENSADAYVVFEVATKEVIYKNKLAEKHFVLTSERANKDFYERIEAQFERREIALFPNTPLRSTSDTTIYCNIEAGYLDLEKVQVWAKITPISSDLNVKRVVETSDSDIIYLEAIPRLYQDVLFRLNPKTKTVVHAGDYVLQFGLPRVLENFPECLEAAKAIHPEDQYEYMAYANDMLKGITGNITVRVKLIDNSYEWFSIETTAVKDMNGELLEVLGKIVNVQDNKNLEEVASFDTLTHTLNSNAFSSVVTKSLKGQDCALFMVDIDDFKYVNETNGHEFGDILLEEIGTRLSRCVRTSDYVGRFLSDKFMIYLKSIDDTSSVEKKAKQVLNAMIKPITGAGKSHVTTVSVGIASYPKDGKTVEELLECATKALDYAKENGKNVATIYNVVQTQEHLVAVLEEEQRYHHALEMLDRSTSAFVVFHKETSEVTSENQKARDMFYNEQGQFDVNTVFGSAENVAAIIKKLHEELPIVHVMTLYDQEVALNNGKSMVCDLEFSYISDDRIYVYLKFTPKNDKKVSLLKTLIEKYKDPVVVVNKDEDLSISYANSLFYSDCGCTEDNFEERYGSTLKELFLPEKQELFMGIIWRTMRSKKVGYIKTALQLANGEIRWLYFDMDKLRVMDSDQKIYCQLMLQDEDGNNVPQDDEDD